MVFGLIHYHGTSFGGETRTRVAVLAGRHACVSFARPEDIEIMAEVCQSFMLDNGAFSAWSRGAPFDMPAYAEWVKAWRLHPGFDWYVMPDVIDDSDGSRNQAMRAEWRNHCEGEMWNEGVPVWHLHESLDLLENWARAPWPRRIAFGSSGAYADIGTQKWWGRMAEAMEVCTDSEGRPLKKLHGLRMLDNTITSLVPFASADSTNVARNMGMDKRWYGPYAPSSSYIRALVLMDRIESHASAARWHDGGGLNTRNGELFG